MHIVGVDREIDIPCASQHVRYGLRGQRVSLDLGVAHCHRALLHFEERGV
jgi:hypothetical protein